MVSTRLDVDNESTFVTVNFKKLNRDKIIYFNLKFNPNATISNVLGQKTAKLIVVNENITTTAKTATAVSRSILEGNWSQLDSLLDDKFTYTGDGYVFTKGQYIGFMQDMRAAFSDFEMILEKTIVEDRHGWVDAKDQDEQGRHQRSAASR